MAQQWCKIATNLDSHPKIRRAGRNGREVFLFALRRNQEPSNPVHGVLPALILEPWYLADQLQMSEGEAAEGVNRCEAAGLLHRDGNAYFIVGWDDDEWGRAGDSLAEGRKTGGKARSSTAVRLPNGAFAPAPASSNPAVSQLESAGPKLEPAVASCQLDQKRGEEIRVEEKRSDMGTSAHKARRRESATPIAEGWRPTDEHAELARERCVDLQLQARSFRAHAEANDRRAVRWNAAFTQWLLKAFPDRRNTSGDGLQYALDVANGVIP